MITGKEIILDYCRRMLNEISVEHLLACEDIIRGFNHNDMTFMIETCPANYGLEDFTGDCEFEKIENDFLKQSEQCKKCWDRALNVTEAS